MKNKKFDYEIDIEPGFYDKIYRKKTGSRFLWHHTKFTRAIQLVCGDNESKPQTWLDVGCGPGTFLGQFRPAQNSIGSDLSAVQIKYASETYTDMHLQFTSESIKDLAEKDQQYDVISMLELIEHIEYEAVDSLFQSAQKLLKPDGLIVVSTPNYRSMWPVIELGLNMLSEVSYEDQHINKYTRKKLFYQMNNYFDTSIHTGVGFAPFLGALGKPFYLALQKVEEHLSYLGMGNLLFSCGRLRKNKKKLP